MEYLSPVTPTKENQSSKEERAMGFAMALKEMQKAKLKPPTKEAEQIIKEKEGAKK